ncbi:MAG: hypothetical protein QNJ33_05045 [Crocosphaera sp.]|nr:hypothetical protein [Crocosphaera sp.]
MVKCVVLGVESSSYTSRSGEEVNYTKMYYFEVSSKANSSLQKGFTLLNKDVYPDFSLSDFSQVPGVYELGFRASRGYRGKLEPKLVSIDFLSPLSIKENKDYFLIIGAKRYNFQPTNGSLMKGVKVFAIDPMTHEESESYLGLQILETSISKAKLDSFNQIPGYYDLAMEQVRGRNGTSIYKAVAATFKESYSLNSPSSPPSVQTSS